MRIILAIACTVQWMSYAVAAQGLTDYSGICADVHLALAAIQKGGNVDRPRAIKILIALAQSRGATKEQIAETARTCHP